MNSSTNTTKLTDADIAKDVLGNLKSGVMLYMNGIIESNCPKMRTLLTKLHVQACENQFETFEYLNKRNLYPVENAEASKVKETVTKFSKPLN